LVEALTAVLAAGVAGGYFAIAALILPRIQLEETSPRFVRAFRYGGIAFFLGCGLTHTHIAYHALADDRDAEWHEIVFHLMQVFGVWLFVFVAWRMIDVRIIRRRSEEELLEQRVGELARSNADLEHFARVVSHDLQAPLRTVSGFAELVRRRYNDRLDAQGEEALEQVVEGCERMSVLLDGVLEYSRAAGSGLQRGTVDTAAVVRDVVTHLSAWIEERDAEIDVGELPSVEGDEVQLAQVFQNLISNALKFTDGRRPRVEVRAVQEDGRWRFDLRDNGIGIAPEDRERVFEMFERGTASGHYEGDGVGLAICRRIVERHGGELTVAPAPDGGSVFTFTLPRIAAPQLV